MSTIPRGVPLLLVLFTTLCLLGCPPMRSTWEPPQAPAGVP